MNSSIRISHCTFWKKRAILSTDSRDYTDASQPVLQKTAYVYLPYGYDEADQETRYNILYLMHGWTMTAGDFFDETRSGIVPMLDHMIESGDIPPLIVVCATFDAENQSQSFSRSVEELSVFHHDLRENLMPCVESRFHTYAEDVTPEAFQASRAHRAFGGFSLGAVTTWYQFIYNLDFIQYFLPMSSDCWIMGTYLWYYFDVQLRQIFGYWALGVALSAVFQRYVPEDLMTAALWGKRSLWRADGGYGGRSPLCLRRRDDPPFAGLADGRHEPGQRGSVHDYRAVYEDHQSGRAEDRVGSEKLCDLYWVCYGVFLPDRARGESSRIRPRPSAKGDCERA